MVFQIKNGIVELNNTPVEPEILYQKGKINVLTEESEIFLVVSKRPAEIRFEFNPGQNPPFTLFFKESALDCIQINSLINHGYFIFNHKRIHFVSSGIKEYVVSAFGDLHLPGLMKLLRTLYQEGLSQDIPSDFLESLRIRQSKKVTDKPLFVQKLYPYQENGVDWLSFCTENGVGTILADDMGLGKTAQVIAVCCEVLGRNPDSKILVVVPNPLLDNWVREFKFFAPDLDPYLHFGSGRRGVSSVLSEHNIIITAYTTMSSDIAMLEEIPFDLGLFDEASMLKNPKSGRSVAARRLSIAVAVAMSGTPVENSLMDAWALADLVFPGFLGDEENFKSRYVHPELQQTLNTDLEELESSLRQITLRRMKKDVLEQLPEKLDIHTAVSLSEKEKAAYECIIDEIQRDKDQGGGGILPLINKLQQFTAHPALIDSTITHDTQTLCRHSAKFELLMLRLDSIFLAKEKVIIFATFQKAIDLIQGAIKEKYGILPGVIDGRTPNDERQPLIDKFSSSKGFDVLILHPRTAGMGLNITAATNVIHYCRQWNPALEAQATARAWRNGQESIVNVYYMFYANTIEETIDERIRLKQQLSDQVVSVADYKETDKQIMLAYLEALG